MTNILQYKYEQFILSEKLSPKHFAVDKLLALLTRGLASPVYQMSFKLWPLSPCDFILKYM